jgi:hypothetical protein
MNAPLHVLSPSSILPPPSSYRAFITPRKNYATLKMLLLKNSLFLKKCVNLKLPNLRLRKSGGECVRNISMNLHQAFCIVLFIHSDSGVVPEI